MDMATTATRAAQARSKGAARVTTRPVAGRTAAGAAAPAKAAKAVTAGVARRDAAAPRSASAKTPAPSEQATNAQAAATPKPPKPTRMGKLLESIESVQAPPKAEKVAWPRWKKILLWVVMLMPVYAIVIYIIGAFYFLPYELRGVGLNKSFTTHVQSMAGTFAVPDQEGVFLQTSLKPQSLSMIMQYNDSSLQPPVNEQMTLAPTGLKYVLIRQAQVSRPTDYQIFPLGSTTPVNLTAQRVPASGVAIIALSMPNGKPWAKGSYEIVVPEAGLDDQFYYCYFTITS